MSTESRIPESGVDQLAANAAVLRRFAVGYLTGHDLSLVPTIMVPGYQLNIGGHLLDGREAQYLPSARTQLEQFPGLCVTVHDVVIGTHAVALRFSEHGASRRDGGRAASWQGVSLFELDQGRFRTGWAEEDYFARKRQLQSGTCDPVESPHPAPWDVPAAAPDTVVELIARAWLTDGRAIDSLSASDGARAADPPAGALIRVTATTIDALFSAGERVAFHVTQSGTYVGGFAGTDPGLVGTPVQLRSAGLLTVADRSVATAHVVLDRLGLQRSLRPR